MIWQADPSVRLDRDERTVTGGAPLRLLKLTERGVDVVGAVLSGTDTSGLGAGERALVARLSDAGMVHPLPESGSSGMDAGDVTVVIPVRDDLLRLIRALGALAETAPGLGGVVVVDDGSRNPVRQAVTARRWPFTVSVVRHRESRGPAAARNAGLAYASTALVGFIDSDCVPAPGWIEPLVDQFFDEHLAAVAPRVVARSEHGTCPHIAAYEVDRSPLDLGDQPALVRPLTRVSYVPTAAVVVRTDVLRTVGGFDEAMRVGEDVDVVWRLVDGGHRVRYDPRSVVQHDTRSTPGGWIAQRFSYGTSAAPLAARHGDNVAPAVVSRSSLAIWLLLAAGHRRLAAVVAVTTTVLARRRLETWPTSEALKLVAVGHFAAGRQLAASLIRVWWPIAFTAAMLSRRARRVVAPVVVATIVDKMPGRPADIGLGLADDMAYGAGVWVGCVRERSLRALLPRMS